ncbi:MAG: hypothetical protein P1R58_08075, partial [bacterium]|nr:hypothetical protein [bacterium]
MRNLIVLIILFGLSSSVSGLEVDPFADSCFVNRGDCNHSGEPNPIDISDLTYFVDFMFDGGSEPVCLMEGDIDASGELDISDLTWLVDYMFLGGQEPPLGAGIDYKVYCVNVAKSPHEIIQIGVLSQVADSFTLPFSPSKRISVSHDGAELFAGHGDSTFIFEVGVPTTGHWLTYSSHNGVEA